MPLNPVKVALAVQGGLSIVCATCQKYWQGRERHLPGDLCTAQGACGSPLSGHAFQEYHGPITDFTRWCFMCGATAAHAVQSPESSRLFGICAEHTKALPELRPQSMELPSRTKADALLVKLKTGEYRTPQQVIGYRKKTLQDAMRETEEDFAKARAARGEEP